MELGITPIVTSGKVMQLLVGSKIIQVDNRVCEDQALNNGHRQLHHLDGRGWTITSQDDYRNWAANKDFEVGDVLSTIFSYLNASIH
ncbi:hypothetical protein Sjap_023734 [Stephania japonica]|uniref:Phytocyanin domain-containing protein n=1 Tax=Stephania japonica TaxID=461633 RepID=A0AAP0EGX1_9MAGN